MSDPLYRKDVLRLAADAHGAGKIPCPDVTGIAFNPACGDKVSVDLSLEGDRIGRFAHQTRACVLTQASASVLGQTIRGAGRLEIEILNAELRAMLLTSKQVPRSPFTAYAVFEGAAEYASRHRCVLLPIEAVLNALNARDPHAAGG